ncbi:mucin-2-like [Ruditapes philippinarum]|uniref:mucin-2-like n=1 Tax=Ruditapes philippinarum TaxID=129788 RepID=UPI00295A78DC|nr:mucin-2-like [Ruditapes philippinarum]XP_060607893.1 mucin-2-like [Ruditapes philippinarum]XP_060607894.1 mucin-2-like [Ruditapes philippinarum]
MTGKEKRQTTDYEVEIFFVHDFAMYNSWYATTEGENDRHSATVTKMIQFTAFLLNAIDLRYQTVTDYSYTISCLFAGIYIADVSSDAPFVEDHVSNNQAVAETVLSAFKEWGEDSLGDFNFDHAMLFTGYDIGETIDGVFISDIAGLAYLPSYNTNGELFNAAVCGTLRYSINEGGNFEPTMATIGAHELGHNLGSSHDGSSNNCSGGYVMEPSLEVSRNASENLELWQFSSCSQTYFDTYITDLNDASLNCMTVRTAINNDDLDPYVNDLAGQLYSPDIQCERIRGSGSFLYRSKYDGNYSTICQSMACASTTTSGSFYYYIPWEGTTCGNGKMCQSGHCVESPLAPPVDNETCLFGDVPYNMPFQTSGCYDFLGTRETSYNCYHETYRLHCCETCEAIRQNNTAYVDCEYGDKGTGCSEISLYSCRSKSELCCRRCQDIQLNIPGCPWGDFYSNCAELPCSTYSEECCQTCASSTTLSITVTPSTTTDTITTTTNAPSATISPSTTTTITSTTTTSAPLTTATSTTSISTPLTTAATSTTATSTPLMTAAISTTLTDSSTVTATLNPTTTITLSLTTADTTSTTITPTATTSSSTTPVSPTPTTTSSPMEAISSRVQVSPTLLFSLFLYQFNKLFG